MSILIKNVEVISPESSAGNGTSVLSEENTNIHIVGDRIVAIGKDDYPEADTIIDGTNLVALPGLVNAHTHAFMTLFRGMGDDLPLDEWLNNRIWPAEAKLTAEDVYWGVKLSLVEMIKSGTTAFADMYFFMEEAVKAVEEAGIRASLSIGMTPFDKDYEEILKESKDFVSRWNGAASGRILTMYGPHAPYTCPPEFLKAVALEAERDGVGIHIHLAETSKEVEDMKEKYGRTPVELAAEAGLFNVHTLAAHCVHLTQQDIKLLAEGGVFVAHNPQSNLKLGSGVAPVPQMLAEGIPVALGTDGAASNNNLDLLEEMRTAALLHKGVNMNPTLMPADDALRMAILNGAQALGFRDTGCLKVGNKADLILMDFRRAHLTPLWDTLSHIVYSSSAFDIKTMIVDGRLIMDKGEILTLDEEEVYFEINRRFKRFEDK